MKKLIFLGLIIALGFGYSPLPAKDKFAWIDDLDQARVLAKKEGKPLFLVFR
jgi:hypothetical protein